MSIEELKQRQAEREAFVRDYPHPDDWVAHLPEAMSDIDQLLFMLSVADKTLKAYALVRPAELVPVTERLPKHREKVLLFGQPPFDGPTIGRFWARSSRGATEEDCWIVPDCLEMPLVSDGLVTHWMPLPAGPAGAGKDGK